MTKTDQIPYEALLTLSIPGAGETVSVTIKLAPTDSVPISGTTKPLSECTITDLQRYAAELEKEVWDTFESIKLLDLKKTESVIVEVVQIGAADQGIDEWTNQLVVFDEISQAAGDSFEDQADASVKEDDTPVDHEPDDQSETAAEEGEPVGVPQAADQIDTTEVSVAETEPVFPDIDEDTIEIADPGEIARPPIPAIIPSKARVRVAGKQLPIGHSTWAAVDILMDEPALRQAQAHALSSLNREVAGVLIGPRPEKQPDGRYLVHVFDTIIAKYTVMQGASVTYTPESWRYLNDTLIERYPDETAVMVGWYHTHPGFGIFLSGMDLFIHQNFFTQIWHVAMVLDPRAKTSGFFCWDRHRANVNRIDFPWPNWSSGSW